MCKGNRLVITDKQRRIDIIHDVHQELDNNVKAVAMSWYLGRTSTYQKVSSRFYWYTIVKNMADYIKGCNNCQKHWSMPKKKNNNKEELKNIAVPLEVVKQIGVDIYCLASVDEFEYLIVCIGYFSKWSDKSVLNPVSLWAYLQAWLFCYPNKWPGQRTCEWSCWWATFDDWHPAKSDIRISPTKQWFSRAPKAHN